MATPMGAGTLRAAAMKRMPQAMMIGFLLGMMDILRALPAHELQSGHWGWIPNVGLCSIFGMVLMVFAITVAERSALGRTRRTLAIALAVVGMALATSTLRCIVSYLVDRNDPGAGPNEWLGMFLYIFWMSCAVGGLAAAYFLQWDRSEQSANSLRNAEIERQQNERSVVESRLSVIKARVEPEFLFSSIAALQALYLKDIDAAERRIDDLITYLRAALPQMRGNETCLGDEIHLALAYLKVNDEWFAGRLVAQVDVSPSTSALHFPPMIVLPLVEDAIRRALLMQRPALRITIRGERIGTALRFAVLDDCPITRLQAAPNSSLATQQSVLHAFYGDGARISRDAPAEGGTRVILEMPHAIA